MHYTHTLAFATWRAIPSAVRGDCMQRISAGVYGHMRMDVCIVVLDEVNTTEGVQVLMDEVVARMPA